MRQRGRESERADVSEVIEARGHPGRKSHESRASGREQCRAALLVRLPPASCLLLPPSLRSLPRRRGFSPLLPSSLLLVLPLRGPLFFLCRRSSRCFTSTFRRSERPAIPPSQSPSALLRVASVLIRFDPRRRLTLKQTLFMTRAVSLRNGPRRDDPRYSVPTSCSHRTSHRLRAFSLREEPRRKRRGAFRKSKGI